MLSATRAIRTAAEALSEVLEAWGIDKVFICPGSTEAAFLDAVSAKSTVDVLLATHESISVAMADGYSRATGKPSVVFLHANVGLNNGLSHLFAAKLARSPIVVLNGLKDSRLQARDGFTTATHMREFVRQYVKWDWQSLSADAITEDVNRALQLATTEPCGPTWVGLSQDLMEAPTAGLVPHADAFRSPSMTRPDRHSVQRAAEILLGAERPLLVAGSEVGRHGARVSLERLAARLQAPVMLEDRRGLERISFSTQHPHFAGQYSADRASVQQADVIFFVGARCFLQFEPPTRPQVPDTAALIHSHVDPVEIGRLYGTDVSLIGHQGAVLEDVLDALDGSAPLKRTRTGTGLSAARLECRSRAETGPRQDGDIRAPEVVEVLSGFVDANTTIVSDATTAASLVLQGLPITDVDQFVTTASGSLGWGMGAALGIQLGRTGRKVIAIVGDGVFQFGVQALWTAAHYRLPVTYVVLNNQSFAAVGAAILRYRKSAGIQREGRLPGVDISGPNIAEIARGFGVRAMRVKELSALRRELQMLGQHHGPALIEVMTEVDDLGPSPL